MSDPGLMGCAWLKRRKAVETAFAWDVLQSERSRQLPASRSRSVPAGSLVPFPQPFTAPFPAFPVWEHLYAPGNVPGERPREPRERCGKGGRLQSARSAVSL